MNTLVLTQNIGGQTLWSNEVDNYLGFQMISGADIVNKFRAHLKRLDDENNLFDLEVKEGVEIKKVEKVKVGEFEIETAAGDV
jgi:alkyl hydroperoxide reductase subunit F